MMIINTNEIGKIFGTLHAAYQIKVKQGDVVHDIIKFDSKYVKGEELEFFFEIDDTEINRLKKENKCLIEELERVKIELHQLKGEIY